MKPLRIYLSSTYEDLKQHRAVVFELLEKAGLPVARMEGYVASDQRPLDLCLQDVAQSDIYVGLFAWRYGYVPPPEHGNPDDRSITELEYRHAMDKRKPILTFLADPSTEAEWPERFRDEKTGDGDCGARLKALKANLGVEKTASFFTTPHQLASLILAAIIRQPMVKRPFMAPALPAGYISRPDKAARIRETLLSAGDFSCAITTAIEGGGGFGKTTLAIDLCHDPEIIKAFPDGILWATFGQNPDLKVELTAIFAALTDERPVFTGVDDVKRSVAEKLERRQCLLVVDDVWRDSHLKPLQEVGAACVLYTTRRRDLDTKAASVEVDEMSRDEAASLLAHDLPLSQDLRPKLVEFAAELGNWPLLLALANARIRSELKQRGALENAFARVSEVYRRRGVTGFDSHNAEKRELAVRLSVSAGLESFDERFRERATSIGLFPEDVPLPVQVLADLWTCGVFEAEEDVLQHLHNLRVVTWDRNANTVAVHDMIRAALASNVSDRASQHAKLLDAWGDRHRLPHAYAWRWIGYHLHGAGRQAELDALLLDLDWLRAKLGATEIDTLVREFDYARGEPHLRILQDALRLSSHLLAKSKSQLPGQLLARLPESEGSLRQSILERALNIREPWLRPLRPSLTAPGGPLVRTLEGHESSVNAVALTPDGKRAVSGSDDQTLKVWDLESGRELRTLEGHASAVIVVALTPDGKRAVSGSDDHTLKVWDLESGRELRTLEGHAGWVASVALTSDGQRAVSGGNDRRLKVWDLESGRELHALEGHASGVTAVALTPDGQCAVSGSDDHTLKVWDLESGRELHTLEGHADWITSVALTPDGKRAVSGSFDRTLKVWDLESGRELHTLEGHARWVNAVALTPDGKRAVSGSFDRTLKVWDVESGRELRTLEGHESSVNAVALTPDGKRAVSGSFDRTLKVWDLESGGELRTLEGHASSVNAVALTAQGKRAVSGGNDSTLKVWDLESGGELRTLEGHASGVNAVALTADGKRAVSGGNDSTLKVWDLESGRKRRTLKRHASSVTAVALTPDGKRAVSGSTDWSLKVWDLWSGRKLRTLNRHASSVTAVALTPDGKRAVSGSRDHTLKVWDLESGRELHTLEGHAGSVTAVALTPDGKRAVSGSWDRTLKVWDLESGRELRTLEGHAGGVTAVALTPDGKRAVSASADRTIVVWVLETGTPVATFGADSEVRACAAARDGVTFVAGDANGCLHFLRLENASQPGA